MPKFIGSIDENALFNSRYWTREEKKQMFTKEGFEHRENELFKANYKKVIGQLKANF